MQKPASLVCINKSFFRIGTHQRFFQTGLLILLLLGLQFRVEAEVPVARQDVLRHMLKQDCGSCHGLTLKGGLGPALTVNEIANKPRQLLRSTILNGRPGTPMPPFRGMLTEEEVHWLVELLYKGDV